MVTERTNAADRALETARALRLAAEEARRTIQTSRDIVQRSREQSLALLGRSEDMALPCADDEGPSNALVDCVLRAYELAGDDSETMTRTLLGSVLHHLGRRIATMVGPKAARVVMH